MILLLDLSLYFDPIRAL